MTLPTIQDRPAGTTPRAHQAPPDAESWPGHPDGAGAGLRLLMVTPRAHPHMGGVETNVTETARRLAARGVSVTLLTTDPSGSLPIESHVDGVTIRRVRAYPANRDYYVAPALIPIITAGAWDLVHIQSYHTFVAPMAMWAARQAGLPYIVTFHGGGHSSALRNALRLPHHLALAPLLRGASRLIATARFEIAFYGRRLRIPPEQFVYIPNGAQFGAISDAPVAVDPNLIVSLGRLERYKGHHRAIAALPHMLKSRPDLRLWVAGSGPYEGELRRLAARLGVADRVEIRGVPASERARYAQELRCAALVLMMSDYETHPMAAIEAALLGCPLLVADTSGLAELAQQGLAQAAPLRSTPAEIAAMALRQLAAPRAQAEVSVATWDACVDDMLSCYRMCLGDR